MSLKCQKIQRLLSDYIDGSLSKRQTTDVALHLGACPKCKREALDLKKTCYLLENFYVEPEASDAYYARFTKTLQQHIERSASTALRQQVRGVGARLIWQLLTRVHRYVDRYIPTGFITVRQKALPYYVLVATMMALLVAPFVLKQVPLSENGAPVSHQPAATLAIQQDKATAQPAEIRRNVSRNRTTEMPAVDSGSDVWQFTDDPLTEGYILATLRKNSKDTLPNVALDIDSELLTYAELPSQGGSWEYPKAREVLTDGRYTLLLLQGIHSGQQVLQQYKRKWNQSEGFSRKLLDVPLETLSITEVYDSIEL